ncbi:MAG: hypothetical protein ACE5DQ_01385 [Candidatus Paceibacterota bacterium]
MNKVEEIGGSRKVDELDAFLTERVQELISRLPEFKGLSSSSSRQEIKDYLSRLPAEYIDINHQINRILQAQKELSRNPYLGIQELHQYIKELRRETQRHMLSGKSFTASHYQQEVDRYTSLFNRVKQIVIVQTSEWDSPGDAA